MMLQEVNFIDKVTGQLFRVRHSDNYIIVSIGPRDYFFVKETGEFDGTGYNFCNKKAESRQREPLMEAKLGADYEIAE